MRKKGLSQNEQTSHVEVKPKMRERKVSGVNWQGVFMPKKA
jgi:hypothetical protein